jgi:hypothetical protein
VRLEGTRRAGGAGIGVEPRARLAHARGGARAGRGSCGLERVGAGLARGGAWSRLERAHSARGARLAVQAGVAGVARAGGGGGAGGGVMEVLKGIYTRRC